MDSIEEKLEKLGRQLEVAEEGFKQEVVAAAKDALLPELTELKAGLNKRIDDFNVHLLDQSRRIDASREELSGRIDEINKRLDRLCDAIVRREDLEKLTARVEAQEREKRV